MVSFFIRYLNNLYKYFLGCIDAAIAHYYFLKSYGLSIEDERMVKARKWILSQGGVEGAQ